MIKIRFIKIVQVVLFVTACSLSNIGSALENSYDLPIKYNSRYVTDPAQIIIDSLLSRGWEIKEQQPGKITGWLNGYKGYEMLLDISYDHQSISFQHISANKLNCGRSSDKKCKMESRHYDKWRLYLRKSIALNIHTLAIKELLNDSNIKTGWLDILKNGSVQEKTQFVRNIIDLEMFDEDALKVIENEVTQGYMQSKLSGHQIQQYAFYCRALARSKKPQYKSLLEKVIKNTPSKKLKKYVEGYLETNYAAI